MSNQPGNRSTDTAKLPSIRPAGPWTRQAACAGSDPDLWFTDTRSPAAYTEAKAICDRCPVQPQCLDWALEIRTTHGLWGGLTPHQRRALRAIRHRRRAS